MTRRLSVAARAAVSALALLAASCAARLPETPARPSPSDLVRAFFDVVRSGRAPERAPEFLAARVRAHQLTSEEEQTIERTPAEYTAHVREMIASYGAFRLDVTEMIAEGDRVYVRWRQVGEHRGAVDGFAPTGRSLVEIASAVYRVQDGRIAEYWIQIDREGLRLQLERGRDGAPSR